MWEQEEVQVNNYYSHVTDFKACVSLCGVACAVELTRQGQAVRHATCVCFRRIHCYSGFQNL